MVVPRACLALAYGPLRTGPLHKRLYVVSEFPSALPKRLGYGATSPSTDALEIGPMSQWII